MDVGPDAEANTFSKRFNRFFAHWPVEDRVMLKDFLDTALKLRPEERPSARELAEHSWLKSFLPEKW